MARFHLNAIPAEPGASFRIDGGEAHHAIHVRRLAVGDEVTVFDGRGGEGLAAIVAVDDAGIALRLVRRTDADRELPVELVVAVAPPRAERCKVLVAAATELGVGELIPLVARRSTVKADARPEATRARWERIAAAAAKQCGRNRLPIIAPPASVGEVAGPGGRIGAADLAVVLVAPGSGGGGEEVRPLRRVLREGPTAPRSVVVVVVGPEGGLTADEVAALAAAGCVRASFGASVLRVETAVLAVVAAVRYEVG